MTYNEFKMIILAQKQPVIILEGTRSLPEVDAPLLTSFARELALTFPHALFRSGNAAGSDDAFSAGIISVDPQRLQYILPFKGSRKKYLAPAASVLSLDDLPPEALEALARETTLATPSYSSMIKNRHSSKKLENMASYLIRDTLKIIGYPENCPPATFGIFYVNPKNPANGGTGHTIRVCNRYNVPVVTQSTWRRWDGL